MKIKEWLREHKKSVEWLSRRVGVTEATVRNWIAGRSVPSGENMRRMLKLTGLTPNDIIGVN